jgi:hypothetical protein
MERDMKRLMASAVCVAALSVLVASAVAATRTPFLGTATFTQITPGTTWQADGVLQVRDQLSVSTVTGGIVGTRFGVFNRAGERVWGDFVLTTAAVTWTGLFQGTFESGCGVTADFVGRGSDGSVLRATFACTGNAAVQSVEGVILDPTG